MLFAHRLLATSIALLGDFDRAQQHFDAAMPLADSARRSALSAEFGFDPGIATMYYYAWASAIQGNLKESNRLAERTEKLCAEQTQVFTRAHTHLLLALRAASLGNDAAVTREADALATLGAMHSLSRYEGYVDVLRNWAAMGQGSPTDQVVAAYRQGIGKLNALTMRVWVPFLMGRLAIGLGAAEHHGEALETIDLALSLCKEAPQGWCNAELWRVRGTLVRDRAEAERSLEQATMLARIHGAKLWELRASVSLARLWVSDAVDAEALDLLRPICAWFTGGPDAPDVVEAREMLNGLVQRTA